MVAVLATPRASYGFRMSEKLLSGRRCCVVIPGQQKKKRKSGGRKNNDVQRIGGREEINYTLFHCGTTKINTVQPKVQPAWERAGDQTPRDTSADCRGRRWNTGSDRLPPTGSSLSAGTVHGLFGSWTLLRRPTLRDRRGGEWQHTRRFPLTRWLICEALKG